MDKKRLKELLYNAIVWLKEDCGDFFAGDRVNECEWFEEKLGITKQELSELGVDDLTDWSKFNCDSCNNSE